MALALLLELAVQRGTLSSILGAVLLLLNLWSSNRNDCDNRLSSSLTLAPLVPLLQRFESISTSRKLSEPLKMDDVSLSKRFNSFNQIFSSLHGALAFEKIGLLGSKS